MDSQHPKAPTPVGSGHECESGVGFVMRRMSGKGQGGLGDIMLWRKCL